MRDDIVVVGAGVIGLTSGVTLAEAGHRVRIVTQDPIDRTTSMVAGALLGPLVPGPDDRVNGWNAASLDAFTVLATQATTGVRISRGRLLSNFPGGVPPWALDVPGYAECATADRPEGFATAFWVDLPVADMPRYLRYLVERFVRAGGAIETGTTVTDLRLGPVVVNCTGVGARDLGPDDDVRAGKGQHVIVTNPGLTEFCYEGGATGEWMGYFPHRERILLGGVDLGDDWSLEPDDLATEQILARCRAAEPRLVDAEVLGVEVGLRPVRSTPRVEAQTLGPTRVVHNYGHGGTGVMLSWGCAAEVLDLVG